ncbi:hypothetical protein [Marinobacter confluentis]|uniref:Uncharacterized protein n=1 Tax=Marinobacter confluentis TaxID=1697557 RepID=A0A4Z1C3U7_9GAMM|nr:hypothetical protein [Marinobacter confluentis]TGN41011.1 hypothetical protein E5Q11_00195 [Marinobacter confluentis]
MIIRIFIVLLALNMLAFVVRAEAGERVFADEMPTQDVYQLQEEMSGDFERDPSDMYAAIGSRLLSLGFSGSDARSRTYASDPARPDHGVALLEEGACLNFKWNF